MRKILYIILIIFSISCSNRKGEAPIPTDKVIETAEVKQENILLEAAPTVEIKTAFNYQLLTKQKLQDYYDLLVLKNRHPEFQEDIKKQLRELSQTSIVIDSMIQQITIDNVQQIGEAEQVSDAIQKITLTYVINNGKEIKTDTISALIKTKTIDLDGEEMIATKIKFVQK